MSGFDYASHQIVWDADSVREACDLDLSDEDCSKILDRVWNECELWETTRDAARWFGFEPK